MKIKTVELPVQIRVKRKKTSHVFRNIFLSALIVMPLIGWYMGYEPPRPPLRPIQYYTVQDGDTLWSIAGQYSDDTQDIRDVYYRIMKENGADAGSLKPGQTLIIRK